MDQQQIAYAEQTQTRMRNINIAVQNITRLQRGSINRDPLIERVMDVVNDRLTLLEQNLTMLTFTQKRVNVIEQYLQEIEVLLNLDQ